MASKNVLARALALSSTVSALAFGLAVPHAVAQEVADEETIIVTATRRAVDIQDVPLNIAAIGEEQIEQLGAGDLSELSQWVPGLHVVNQGARSSNPIIVRGLNADPSSSNDGANDGGGTVATYLGEVPIFVDLRLNDMERVEVLLGPQGTLYGAGTLGGAIRYIPNRPDFTAPMIELRGDAYDYSEGEDISTDFGFTLNAPISDTFAIRASVDFLNDTGFIDYNYVVQEPGISNPDPDFNDPAAVAANLSPVADANTEEVVSGRIAARWNPIPSFDATVTYYVQAAEYGGRTVSGLRSTLATEEYVSPLRVLEPNRRDNQLLALEMSYDLGWGEIISATAASRYQEEGQRDQSDLLIGLEYSYEAFPSFTAFTRETGEEETVTQELRLVSNFDSPFNFIVGGFYNHFDAEGDSREFTPYLDEYITGFDARPDDLEYYSVSFQKLIEKAVFGELTWNITPAWDVTVGARYYDYNLVTQQAVDIPLFNTLFGGGGPDEINLAFETSGQAESGTLYKFNTSYDLTDDAMIFFTVSQGYRIGNTNSVAPCVFPLPPGQNVCASPGEEEFLPDQTTNYELGARTQWMDGALTLNGSIFYIDWTDPQVQSATAVGLQPINVNAAGAKSAGVDFSINWDITENLSIRGSYAYTNAELTEDAPRLIRDIVPPGFNSTLVFIDGRTGDRLPGSPEQQGTFYVTYNLPTASGLEWDFNYGVSGVGDILTRTGGRGDNTRLESYVLHNASIIMARDDWSVTLYAKNLLDEFVETSARGGEDYNQFVFDDNGDPHAVRTFYTDVLPPRTVGVRFTTRFGG